MRHIAISVTPARVERLRRFIPDVEVFEGTSGCDRSNYRTTCIPDTYMRFEQWAVTEGLGMETVVMQDDVGIPHGPGFQEWTESFDTELLILGKDSRQGVAPLAFLASPRIHLLLAGVWTGTGRIIPAWMPIVEAEGLVLDVTQDMGGPPSAG